VLEKTCTPELDAAVVDATVERAALAEKRVMALLKRVVRVLHLLPKGTSVEDMLRPTGAQAFRMLDHGVQTSNVQAWEHVWSRAVLEMHSASGGDALQPHCLDGYAMVRSTVAQLLATAHRVLEGATAEEARSLRQQVAQPSLVCQFGATIQSRAQRRRGAEGVSLPEDIDEAKRADDLVLRRALQWKQETKAALFTEHEGLLGDGADPDEGECAVGVSAVPPVHLQVVSHLPEETLSDSSRPPMPPALVDAIRRAHTNPEVTQALTAVIIGDGGPKAGTVCNPKSLVQFARLGSPLHTLPTDIRELGDRIDTMLPVTSSGLSEAKYLELRIDDVRRQSKGGSAAVPPDEEVRGTHISVVTAVARAGARVFETLCSDGAGN